MDPKPINFNFLQIENSEINNFEIEEGAKELYEIKKQYEKAGFSKEEAFQLLITMISTLRK